MKKNLFITALILSLMPANNLSAKEVHPEKQIKPKINLSEIVLDTKQEFILTPPQFFWQKAQLQVKPPTQKNQFQLKLLNAQFITRKK